MSTLSLFTLKCHLATIYSELFLVLFTYLGFIMVIIKLYRGNYFKLKMAAVNSENKKTFESVNENQESNEILPAIVDGKFFKIVAR